MVGRRWAWAIGLAALLILQIASFGITTKQNYLQALVASILSLNFLPETLIRPLLDVFADPVSNFGVDQLADDDKPLFARNEVSITINPKDPKNLVSASHKLDETRRSANPTVECEFSRSDDGGLNWKDHGVLVDDLLKKTLPMDHESSGADPTLTSDSEGNHYYSCMGFERDILVFRSDKNDGGKNFINTAGSGKAAVPKSTVRHDKPWITADQNSDPNHKCKNFVYLTYIDIAVTDVFVMFVRSQDMGKSWDPPLFVERVGINHVPYPFVDPVTGDVYVTWWKSNTADPDGSGPGPHSIMIAKSGSCGQSFGQPQVVDDDVFGHRKGCIDDSIPGCPTTPENPNELIEIQGCVDGNMLVRVVWRDFDDATSTDSDIHYSSSPKGMTGPWSPEIVVNKEKKGDQFFPTIDCRKDQADIAWGDQRLDPGTPDDTGMFDVYYRSVMPNGLGFGPEHRVTDFTQDATPANAQYFANPIAGDYFDSTVNDNAFYVTWTDFRTPDDNGIFGSRFVDKGIILPKPVIGKAFATQICCVVPADEFLKGERIGFAFFNDGDQTIVLPNTNPWVISNSRGAEVFRPLGLPVQTEVKPGERKDFEWDQQDNNGNHVPLGAYSFALDTLDGSTYTAFFEIIAQPDDRTSMNTVINKNNIVKTIHAEKEILKDQNVIREVTIYAEIYELLFRLPNDPTIKKQVEVVTCQKLIDDAVVLKCEQSKPSEDSGLIASVQNCIENPISHPQEMNTVVGTTKVGEKLVLSIVKTIEAQKEVFSCENGAFIKDVVIFTEIFENLNLLPNNPVIMKQFEVLTCLKDAATLEVKSCVFSPTTRIFP